MELRAKLQDALGLKTTSAAKQAASRHNRLSELREALDLARLSEEHGSIDRKHLAILASRARLALAAPGAMAERFETADRLSEERLTGLHAELNKNQKAIEGATRNCIHARLAYDNAVSRSESLQREVSSKQAEAEARRLAALKALDEAVDAGDPKREQDALAELNEAERLAKAAADAISGSAELLAAVERKKATTRAQLRDELAQLADLRNDRLRIEAQMSALDYHQSLRALIVSMVRCIDRHRSAGLSCFVETEWKLPIQDGELIPCAYSGSYQVTDGHLNEHAACLSADSIDEVLTQIEAFGLASHAEDRT